MSKQPLATININIGLGPNNPKLLIYSSQDIPAQIENLIQTYKLPSKVYDIILERVKQQLPKTLKQLPKMHQNAKNIANTVEKRPTVVLTPTKKGKNSEEMGRTKQFYKENQRNISNVAVEQAKKSARKSVSHLKLTVSNAPAYKKIELRPSKSPLKTQYAVKKTPKAVKIMDNNTKMAKLFQHLTKTNPKNVQKLSPEHINLKNIDKGLLNQLQQFFLCLQEQEFDRLDLKYFRAKVEQLGFKNRFGKKEYEYSYIH